MPPKKSLCRFYFFAVIFCLSGCITGTLYQDDFYLENVKSVLVSNDGEKLVFLSDDFHYIFDLPRPMREVLESASLQMQVHASFSDSKTQAWTLDGFKTENFDFYVDRSGTIYGEVLLTLKETASKDAQIRAQSIGFEEQGGKRSLKVPLKGKRYASNGIPLPLSTNKKLNGGHGYTVQIRDSYDRAKAITLTPITMAGDVASVAVGVALVPIVIPFVVICANANCSPLPMMAH